MPPSSFRTIFWITLSSSLLAGLFVRAESQSAGGADSLHAFLHGAAIGGLIGGAISSLDLFVLRRASGDSFRRLPFLAYFGLRSLVYLSIILSVQAAVNRLMPGPGGEIAPITGADMIFSLSLALGYNLLLGVNALLGPGVLFAFVAGRYYHPRIEERVFLFVDMRASTGAAERLGDARFMDFLNRFIADVSLAIVAAGGEIHKYVGDEIIATWRLEAGPNEAACVEACFAALDRLAADAPAYEREFGLRADFRAALHCGAVAVGELGFVKKEIALIGDAMNTTARLLEACRDADCGVLASAALLERIAALPAGVTRRGLGPSPLRGKERALEIFALEARGHGDASAPPAVLRASTSPRAR
jgi:adenylate cyclase